MFNLKKDELVGNVDDIINNILSANGEEYEIDISEKEEENKKENKK